MGEGEGRLTATLSTVAWGARACVMRSAASDGMTNGSRSGDVDGNVPLASVACACRTTARASSP